MWLELPDGRSATSTADRLLREGVAVTPAEAFLAAPGPAPEALRISLSAPREVATLARALETIAVAIRTVGDESATVRL